MTGSSIIYPKHMSWWTGLGIPTELWLKEFLVSSCDYKMDIQLEKMELIFPREKHFLSSRYMVKTSQRDRICGLIIMLDDSSEPEQVTSASHNPVALACAHGPSLSLKTGTVQCCHHQSLPAIFLISLGQFIELVSCSLLPQLFIQKLLYDLILALLLLSITNMHLLTQLLPSILSKWYPSVCSRYVGSIQYSGWLASAIFFIVTLYIHISILISLQSSLLKSSSHIWLPHCITLPGHT